MEKEKAARESSELYPTKIEMETYVGNSGVSFSELADRHLMSLDGVKIVLTIDHSAYRKEDISESVKRICQKLIEYFY